jgi:hypothetical protein
MVLVNRPGAVAALSAETGWVVVPATDGDGSTDIGAVPDGKPDELDLAWLATHSKLSLDSIWSIFLSVSSRTLPKDSATV